MKDPGALLQQQQQQPSLLFPNNNNPGALLQNHIIDILQTLFWISLCSEKQQSEL
jgi:hypothetical protein